MNKRFFIPALVLSILILGGTAYVGAAKAAETNTRRNEMAQQLAQKLGIDQGKIETAMGEIRVAHQAERKAEMTANLDKAVAAGTITTEQKDKLLAKIVENQLEPGRNKGEMRTWAEENGIDMSKLKDYGFAKGPGQGRGMGLNGNFNK